MFYTPALFSEGTMPKNPNKSRCTSLGCRAWAKRGESLCASHMRAQVNHQEADLILPLLQNVAKDLTDGAIEDLVVLDKELRHLYAVRATFVSWVQRLGDKGPPAVDPTRFLRAWNDSTMRVIQLLRARHDLADDEEGEFGPLIKGVYELMERDLPGGDQGAVGIQPQLALWGSGETGSEETDTAGMGEESGS